MTAIEGLNRCWRAAERVGDLQITWHDATPSRTQHAQDDSRPSVHAVVVGRVLPKTRLVLDCSGGKVKAVDPISALYTRDEAEAETAYHQALSDSLAPRSHYALDATPCPSGRASWRDLLADVQARQDE